MFFKRKRQLRREREKNEELFQKYASEQEEFYHGLPQDASDELVVRHQVVSYCEQMLDISREVEDARVEYQLVTSYLNDIQTIEEMPEGTRKLVTDTATNIINLTRTKDAFMKTDRKITDSQFAQMQQEEMEIPNVVKRFEANEAYLDTINKDLHYLEGEKVEWDIVRQECVRAQRLLRRFSFVLFFLFISCVIALLVVAVVLRMDMKLELLIVFFVAALMGTYTLFKFQDCTKEIHRCDVNRNYAVTLENRVKIRYINVKNAVDYTCEKYHVSNAKELVYIYEKYQEVVKEQERLRQMNEDMAYYESHLVELLRKNNVKDADSWIGNANALVDNKEMVEVKHNLFLRRKKLRTRIEYNMDALVKLKTLVEANMNGLSGENREQIRTIIDRIEEVNQNAI